MFKILFLKDKILLIYYNSYKIFPISCSLLDIFSFLKKEYKSYFYDKKSYKQIIEEYENIKKFLNLKD